MPNPENLVNFKEGEDERRNLEGRPVGAKNRSTIARQVLAMRAVYPDKIFLKLKELYPEITKQMTIEEIGNIIIADKMIREADVSAYNALNDSAYGKAKQEIDQTNYNYNAEITAKQVKDIAKKLEEDI